MISFFNILFSIKISIDSEVSNSFSITPTYDCQQKLNQLGLLYKSFEGGGNIIIEQLGDGLGLPKPRHRISQLTDFNFLINLKDTKILREIRPFRLNPPDPDIPDFLLGSSWRLMFNNLDATTLFINDAETNLSFDPIADPAVGENDLVSVTLNRFGYTETDLNIPLQQITLTPVRPNGAAFSPYDLSNPSRTTQIELADGAFQFRRAAITNYETIFASASILGSNALGLVQIFKDDTIDYNTRIDYEIPFTT